MTEKKQSVHFFLLIVLIGLGTIVLSALFRADILRLFSSDGRILLDNLDRIIKVSRVLLLSGSTVILLGVITMKIRPLVAFLENRIASLNWFLLGLVSFYCLIIAEIVLRANPLYSTKEILERSPAYLPSAMSQHRFDPQKQTVLSHHFEQPDTAVWINNGYRGERFEIPKRDDELRILIFGGSHVYDLNAKYNQDWPNLTERILRENGLDNIRIINAGTPGHRSFDAIGRLVSEIYLYQPDYFIFCCIYNDLKYFPWLSPNKTAFQNLPALGEPSHKYDLSLLEQVLEKSQVFLRMKSLFLSVKRAGVPKEDYGDSHPTNNALKQYALNLQIIIDICSRINIQPIFFTEARLLTEHTLDEMKSRGLVNTSSKMTLEDVLLSYSKCDSILMKVAGENDVPFFDLAKSCSGRFEYFGDIVHVNGEGSRCLAENTAEFLREQVLCFRASKQETSGAKITMSRRVW